MLRRILFHLVEDAIRWISGPIGVRLRRAYYARRLKRCGRNLRIELGVEIVNPDRVSLGDNVWIDRRVIILAGPPRMGVEHRVLPGGTSTVKPGEVVIGSEVHLGIDTIIQGHGGVVIGDGFGTSPGVKVFSFSNDYRRPIAGVRKGVGPSYILAPVWIGDHVWMGLDSCLLGHVLGSGCFVKPGSLVMKDFPENSILSGNPAMQTGVRFEAEAPAQ